MFNIEFSEIALIAVVALLVLGPERLPKVARTVGALVRRARSSWQGVRAEIERELAAEDIKRTIHDTGRSADIRGELRDAAADVRNGTRAGAPIPSPPSPPPSSMPPAAPPPSPSLPRDE